MCTHQSRYGKTLPFPDNAIKSPVLHVTSSLLPTEANKSHHICHNKGAITLEEVTTCVGILILSSCSIKALRWKCTQGVGMTPSPGAKLCADTDTTVQEQGCICTNCLWNFRWLHLIKPPAVCICLLHLNVIPLFSSHQKTNKTLVHDKEKKCISEEIKSFCCTFYDFICMVFFKYVTVIK